MTTRSIATHERELRDAQRQADIDKVAALERELVGAHRQSFPKAQRTVLPPAEPVDPEPIRRELEAEAGVQDLVGQLGDGESPPIAAPPEPIDRYRLMRDFRGRARQGIPFWRIRDRIEAACRADEDAEAAAEVEAGRRRAAQEGEQERLDGLWLELQQARAAVVDELPGGVAAEEERRESARAAEQQEVDEAWEKLQANDPEVTLPALNKAFDDNEAPATAIRCEGNRTIVVMQFPVPEAIVPERKPARTPTGKRTLKKRTKTEINAMYVEALGSNALATVKEGFAVAPGTEIIELLVVRRDSGESEAIYFGEFNRDGYEGASGSRDPAKALTLASEAMLNLKGKTGQVAPLDLADRPELSPLLGQSLV